MAEADTQRMLELLKLKHALEELELMLQLAQVPKAVTSLPEASSAVTVQPEETP